MTKWERGWKRGGEGGITWWQKKAARVWRHAHGGRKKMSQGDYCLMYRRCCKEVGEGERCRRKAVVAYRLRERVSGSAGWLYVCGECRKGRVWSKAEYEVVELGGEKKAGKKVAQVLSASDRV